MITWKHFQNPRCSDLVQRSIMHWWCRLENYWTSRHNWECWRLLKRQMRCVTVLAEWLFASIFESFRKNGSVIQLNRLVWIRHHLNPCSKTPLKGLSPICFLIEGVLKLANLKNISFSHLIESRCFKKQFLNAGTVKKTRIWMNPSFLHSHFRNPSTVSFGQSIGWDSFCQP